MSTLPYNTITSTTSVYPPADHGRQVRQHSSTHFPGPITLSKARVSLAKSHMAPCPSSVKPSQGCGTQHSPQDRAYMPSDRVVGQCGQEPKNYSSTSKLGLFKPNMSVYKPLSSQKGKKKKTMMLGKGDAAAHQSGRFFTTYLHGVPF